VAANTFMPVRLVFDALLRANTRDFNAPTRRTETLNKDYTHERSISCAGLLVAASLVDAITNCDQSHFVGVISTMWGFGISEVTTWPWTFEDDISRYSALGAEAIEIWEFKLERDANKRRDQILAAGAQGLAVSSFQADIHALFPTHLKREPAALDARRDAFLHTLDTLAPLLPGTVFVLNTGVAAHGDVQTAFDITVAVYRDLARRAAELGVRLALEPLHPLAMNEDSFAWNLEDALDIVDAVGAESLGICADIWNLAGQYDLATRLARCAGKIFLAQVSDYRRPRSFLDRLAVGDGSIDYRQFLSGIDASGYAGPLVLEIFSKNVPDSLYDSDLYAVVERSREALGRLLGGPPQPQRTAGAMPRS
jgi:sugar phosphate isomerase/epimerase